MELLQAIQGLQISRIVHNLLRIVLRKHNYREHLINMLRFALCISWSILSRSVSQHLYISQSIFHVSIPVIFDDQYLLNL